MTQQPCSQERTHHWTNSMAVAALVAVVALGLACESGPKHPIEQSPAPMQAAVTSQVSGNPFRLANLSSQIGQSLNQITSNPNDLELQWSLAVCQCTPLYLGKVLTSQLLQPGVLPQPLVPSVREEILSNSSLKILNSLPLGLGNAFASLFASDDSIATSIRDGLSQKLQTGLVGGSRIGSQIKFRFDHFGGSSPSTNPTPPRGFQVTDQAIKWSTIFGLSHMWEGGPPLAYGDHGLQLLATMRSLSEWQYIFGLERSKQNGKVYGGLTLDFAQPLANNMTPYDLRANANQPARFVSGVYEIDYAKMSTVDLAAKGSESWLHRAEVLDINEQSILAYSAALAFSRMRPEARQQTNQLYGAGQTAIFPSEVHQLPLTFLTSFGTALSQGFVDKNSRVIFSRMRFSGDSQPPPASFIQTLRLTRTLVRWTKELANISTAQLSADTAQRLSLARNDLRLATQNALQTIIANFMRVNVPTSRIGGFVFVASPDASQAAELSHAAEALATLAEAHTQGFSSPLLEDRLVALANAHANLMTQSAVSATTILWTAEALKQLRPIANRRPELAWIPDAASTLNEQISQWDRGVQR